MHFLNKTLLQAGTEMSLSVLRTTLTGLLKIYIYSCLNRIQAVWIASPSPRISDGLPACWVLVRCL